MVQNSTVVCTVIACSYLCSNLFHEEKVYVLLQFGIEIWLKIFILVTTVLSNLKVISKFFRSFNFNFTVVIALPFCRLDGFFQLLRANSIMSSASAAMLDCSCKIWKSVLKNCDLMESQMTFMKMLLIWRSLFGRGWNHAPIGFTVQSNLFLSLPILKAIN